MHVGDATNMADQARPQRARYDDTEDLQIVRAIARGDTAALTLLYERYGRYLLSYLKGKLGDHRVAEEVLQDVMVAVWRGAGRFRARSRVRTWLLAIAHNRAATTRRKRQLPTVSIAELPIADDGAMSDVRRRGQACDLGRAMRQLCPEYRETIELVFYHGLSGREAAKVMGVREGTVKSRLHRAKQALREILGEEYDAQI